MTTKLTVPIVRETSVEVRTHKGKRNLIVTLQGDCITFRPKGLRDIEILDIKEAYGIAQLRRLKGSK
tara:strand:- start:61 stop:261 length:201 start_codon:yes stop_codon:yes gene_type:complete